MPGQLDMGRERHPRSKVREHAVYYLEEILQDAASMLITTPDEEVDDLVERVLGSATCAAGAERGFLFQREDQRLRFELSHLWTSVRSSTEVDPYVNLDSNRMPFAAEMVQRAEAFQLQAGSGELPRESGEITAMRERGLRSVLAIPVQHRAETIALLGLSTVSHDTSWGRTEISLLRSIGAVLVSGLLRARRTLELAQKDRTIRTLLDSTSEIAILTDTNARILLTNQTFADLLNSTPEELVGESAIGLAPPETHTHRSRVFESVVNSRRGAEDDIYVDDRIFSMSLSPVVSDQGIVTQVAIFGRDVTEQRALDARRAEYEHRLRELANEITLAEERQRQSLATELHNRVTQPLVALRLKIARITTQADYSAAGLAELSQIVREAISETEAVTREIASPTLSEQGLPAALESLTHALGLRHSLEIHLEIDGQRKPLPREACVLLYHAAREFLTNTIKHAHANVVDVSLRFETDHVQLLVIDDGIGLQDRPDPPAGVQWSGFGLFIIKERLRLMGGSLRVTEARQGGTRVCAILPFSQKSAMEESVP